MVRELEIKRRDSSTPKQQQQIAHRDSNISYSEQQQHSDGVRRLVPSVPNEQVEVLKTNVGRLQICKRHVTLTAASSQNDGQQGRNGILGRLKLVRPNKVVGSQSIFDQNRKQKLSIKDKISQGVVPLNSNQFVKGENGRWTKLDQPTKKLSLSTLRAQIRNRERQEVSEDDQEYDDQEEGDSYQREEDQEYESQGEEEYLDVVEEKRNNKGSQEQRDDQYRDNTNNNRKESRNQNILSNNSKTNTHTSLKTLSNNINVNRQQQQTGQISASRTAGKTTGTSSNDNSSINTGGNLQKNSKAQPSKSPDFEIEEDQTNNDCRFVVAVNNLPRKSTESDIRSLLRQEKGDILEIVLEEGDSYDCLIYFSTESSQLRAVKLLDNKKFEGQILRADPAEVIITKQGQNEEQLQHEGESDRDIHDSEEDDDYQEQVEQEKQIALNQRIKQNQQQSQQQSKNMISQYIQKNKDSQQQPQVSNTTTNNKSISSRIMEPNKSSRQLNSSNNNNVQESSRSQQQQSRIDGQQNSRNTKEQILQQQMKNTRKDKYRGNSQSHSRERAVVRNNNFNNASLTPERSPNRRVDKSASRSRSERNRSDSSNRNRRHSSPIVRYANNSNNGQGGIHRRSRQSQSPDRGRLSPQIRGSRNTSNIRENTRNNDRGRQQNISYRDNNSVNRKERDNTYDIISRERNSRRDSPKRGSNRR